MGMLLTELMTGWDASVDRAHLDHETNCIIIADDSSPVQTDGLLVSWNVFARQPGTVALDVCTCTLLFYIAAANIQNVFYLRGKERILNINFKFINDVFKFLKHYFIFSGDKHVV